MISIKYPPHAAGSLLVVMVSNGLMVVDVGIGAINSGSVIACAFGNSC